MAWCFPAVPASVKDSRGGHRPGAWSGLLRVLEQIHRRIIRELNAAGFDELREPHMAVLQFPGPNGVRPSALAERAGMSKQAMNQLLRSLEGFAIERPALSTTLIYLIIIGTAADGPIWAKSRAS